MGVGKVPDETEAGLQASLEGNHDHPESSTHRALERLRFTFTPNGKLEFVPRDQVFPLFFVYCLLLLHKNK